MRTAHRTRRKLRIYESLKRCKGYGVRTFRSFDIANRKAMKKHTYVHVVHNSFVSVRLYELVIIRLIKKTYVYRNMGMEGGWA